MVKLDGKSTAARYAQLRRDKEAEHRERLRALLPKKLFTAELEGDGELNLTTKILLVTIQYLEALRMDTNQTTPQLPEKNDLSDREQVEPMKHREKDMSKSTVLPSTNYVPFLIPCTLPPHIPSPDVVRQLRQVAQRVVHKAEERLVSDGAMTYDMQRLIDEASDTMIDTVEKIRALS